MEIGRKGLWSLVISLKDRPLERIASQSGLQVATQQIGNLPWQLGELVAVEPQCPEAGELADLGRQRGEPVGFEHQVPEADELPDLVRQSGELVAAEPQPPEADELADLGG